MFISLSFFRFPSRDDLVDACTPEHFKIILKFILKGIYACRDNVSMYHKYVGCTINMYKCTDTQILTVVVPARVGWMFA